MSSAPTIGFAFDFTNAASLLAFRPTCALADELGIDVDWLPFPTEVRMTASARGDESVGDRHARVRAAYFARDTARYAAWQGIEVNRSADGVDSSLACAGCLWANRGGVARPYVERVLFEFWAGRVEIEDRDALTAVLDDVGATGFDDFDFAGDLAAHKTEISARGVFNVPTYLADNQLFTGREHLPMIRWLLTGSEGPGPL